MNRLLRFLFVLYFFIPQWGKAQIATRPFAIGIWGGLTEYNGDLGNGFYNGEQDIKLHGGLSLAWYVTDHFDFAMNTTIGGMGFEENEFRKFEATQLQWNGHIRGHLFKAERFKVNPYLLAGVGISYLRATRKPGTDFFFPFGAGFKIRLNEKLNLLLQETFAYTDHDTRDGEEADNFDSFLMHSVGLTYNLAAAADADKDGVSDKQDKCPDTPKNAKVDGTGCPLDRDGDGIADITDACPDVKGVASAQGCPDKDGDGVTDMTDRCPELAGLPTNDLSTNGCPDKDGDGIIDSDDRCPELKGTAEWKGCPDSDGDGIVDPDDRCPSEKGLTELNGCPDKDNDKVADVDDKCPDTPGIAANKGCPEVKEEVKKLFTQALQGIQFETGKETIRRSSFVILDNVVKVMNDNPAYLLEINGHTDNTGKADANLNLSQRRADAVKAYLEGKGIAAARLTAKGYGDTLPVADNKTAEGRSKNRRVEFKINF